MKWALITGASSGIGAATARQLAKDGYALLLVARRAEKLAALKKEILLQFPDRQIQVAGLDVADREAVEEFCTKNQQVLKSISVLVNNAGLAKGTDKVQTGNVDDWEAMINTNVKGLLYLTRQVLPVLIAQKQGHIVNIGSVAGRWVYPGGAVYCASKFAVRALSEGLRMDLLGTNIRVTNIEPGMVNTEFSLTRFGDQAKADAVYAGMKPLTGEDIAETIGWVLGRPQHVNVQELVIYPTDQASVRDTFRI